MSLVGKELILGTLAPCFITQPKFMYACMHKKERKLKKIKNFPNQRMEERRQDRDSIAHLDMLTVHTIQANDVIIIIVTLMNISHH